jgi:hypothetical protein
MSRSRDENSEIIHPSSSPRPNPPSPLNTKSRVPQASNHRPPPHENPMPSDQEKAHPPSPVGGSRTKALTAAPQIDVNYSSHGYVCMTLVMAIHTHGPIVILGYSQIPVPPTLARGDHYTIFSSDTSSIPGSYSGG